MTRKPRTTFIAGITTVICALTISYFAVGATGAATPTAQDAIQVESFVAPLMPISFNSAVAKRMNDRTALTYSVSNHTSEKLNNIQIVAFVIAASGEVRGGEGWVVTADPTMNASAEETITLESNVTSGDHVLLSIWKAQGKVGRFEIDSGELVKAVKAKRTSVGQLSPPKVKFIRARAETDSCTTANDIAVRTCGCGGVSKFSCNPSNGLFSYECFPKNGCKQEVGVSEQNSE